MNIWLVKLYIYTSWLPLFLYVVGVGYLETIGGWGQWAAASVVLPSLFISLAYVISGLFVVAFFRDAVRLVSFWGAFGLSSSIVLMYLARTIWLEL